MTFVTYTMTLFQPDKLIAFPLFPFLKLPGDAFDLELLRSEIALGEEAAAYSVTDLIVAGEDVLEPLSEAATWTIHRPTIFVFLPERLDELENVRASYPAGLYYEHHRDREGFLFAVYEVQPDNE